MTYRDRRHAGANLARLLRQYADRGDVTVCGLPRGGVPVAAAVARALHAPLDLLVVRKLGVPSAPEVAFGAVGPNGVLVLNEPIARRIAPVLRDGVIRRERAELARREARYRSGRAPLALLGRTAVLVDDGLATGATARAAVSVAHRVGAARVVVAAPVGSVQAVRLLARTADEVICPVAPDPFDAVSRYYDDFAEVTDLDVVRLLAADTPSGENLDQ
jgi:predicted phosphoribosyltransferase